MLDQLDNQISKLTQLNDTLKTNLQKYIREQNDEIKKVTEIVKSLKRKRNVVEKSTRVAKKNLILSPPTPPLVARKVITARKPSIPVYSPPKKRKLHTNSSQGNLKDPFVPILSHKKKESKTPNKNQYRPNSFLTRSESEKQHILPIAEVQGGKSAMTLELPAYESESRPLQPESRGYKT